MTTKAKILMILGLLSIKTIPSLAMDEKQKLERTREAIKNGASIIALEERLILAQMDLESGKKWEDEEKIKFSQKRIILLEDALQKQNQKKNKEEIPTKENHNIIKEPKTMKDHPIAEKETLSNSTQQTKYFFKGKQYFLTEEYTIKGNQFVVTDDVTFWLFRSQLDKEDVHPTDIDTTIKKGTSSKGSHKCFHFARETIGLNELPYFELKEYELAQELKKHFDAVTKPQKGDLVVYYTNETSDITFNHFGVAVENNMVESKWGEDDVFIHPLFRVPRSYGNVAMYYRPKPNGKYAQCIRRNDHINN